MGFVICREQVLPHRGIVFIVIISEFISSVGASCNIYQFTSTIFTSQGASCKVDFDAMPVPDNSSFPSV